MDRLLLRKRIGPRRRMSARRLRPGAFAALCLLACLCLALPALAAESEPGPGPGPTSCTIVMAKRDGLTLVGNNEDFNDRRTVILFRPAAGTSHGAVFFGFSDGYVQGGMNDAGLFVDGNALEPTGWEPEAGKPTWERDTIKQLLLGCADCAEVEAFFLKHNVPELGAARFPVADRSGASMVVEYAEGKVRFVRSGTWYLIATNFLATTVRGGFYPCARYRLADRMLTFSDRLDISLVEEILQRTHQEGDSLTVYSNIYDLQKGTVRVYNLRNFYNPASFSLEEELAKGYRRMPLSSLFAGH